MSSTGEEGLGEKTLEKVRWSLRSNQHREGSLQHRPDAKELVRRRSTRWPQLSAKRIPVGMDREKRRREKLSSAARQTSSRMVALQHNCLRECTTRQMVWNGRAVAAFWISYPFGAAGGPTGSMICSACASRGCGGPVVRVLETGRVGSTSLCEGSPDGGVYRPSRGPEAIS